jgi:hypothetical protein
MPEEINELQDLSEDETEEQGPHIVAASATSVVC